MTRSVWGLVTASLLLPSIFYKTTRLHENSSLLVEDVNSQLRPQRSPSIFLLHLELVWKLSLHLDMKAFTIHCGRSWQESFALHIEVAWEISLHVEVVWSFHYTVHCGCSCSRKLCATRWGCVGGFSCLWQESFALHVEVAWELSHASDKKALRYTLRLRESFLMLVTRKLCATRWSFVRAFSGWWQKIFALHVEVAWELSLLVLLAGDPVEEAEHRVLDWLVLLLTAGMTGLVQPERWGSQSTQSSQRTQSTHSSQGTQSTQSSQSSQSTEITQSTQSARLSVQSSELGPPHPLTRKPSIALPLPSSVLSPFGSKVETRGSQRGVVYLGWPAI